MRCDMPTKPPRCCAHPGCMQLAYSTGLCDEHHKARLIRQEQVRQKRQAVVDLNRGSAASRGYDRRWRAYRESFLRKHPLCKACEDRGRVAAATVVDHIVAHRGDSTTFWDKSNHQPLCVPCHATKTLAEMRARREEGKGVT